MSHYFSLFFHYLSLHFRLVIIDSPIICHWIFHFLSLHFPLFITPFPYIYHCISVIFYCVSLYLLLPFPLFFTAFPIIFHCISHYFFLHFPLFIAAFTHKFETVLFTSISNFLLISLSLLTTHAFFRIFYCLCIRNQLLTGNVLKPMRQYIAIYCSSLPSSKKRGWMSETT